MVAEIDGKAVWDLIYKLTAAQYTKFHSEPENKDVARTNPRENVSGQVYTIVNDMRALGVPIEVPEGVLRIFEPQPIVAAVIEESKGLIRTVVEMPVTFGSGVLDGAKKLLSKLYHSVPIVAPEEKPKEEG
jgi:hypothetical protein